MPALFKNKMLWLLVGVLAAGGWWWWHGKSAEETARPAIIVRVAPVEQRDMPVVLKNVGTVVTNDSVAVRARLDSQVMEVKFRDGDYVEEGQLLFVLDDRVIKADLAREQAELANLRQQFDRARQLAAKEYETQANLDSARAAYEAQQAAVESTRVLLDYTRITAPISGRTGTINITAGNTVKANDTQPLVTINQIKPIRAQVALPQRYLDNVRQSMRSGAVPVTAIREGGGTSQGTLEYIDNAVDSSTGTFAARASFPNDDEALWPGMFVSLVLTLSEEKGALVIPEVAIQHGQASEFVFAIEGDKAVKKNITVARLQEGIAVIEKGLSGGEQVAVDGIMSLSDGSKVTIAADKAPESQP